MKGSEFRKVDNIILGCISQDAKDLLDTVMEEWKIHEKKLKELKPNYEPSHYAFAYWLIRWSGLVKPNK